MSKAKQQQQQNALYNSRDEINKARQPLSRTKSVDPINARQSYMHDLHRKHIDRDSLEEYGYYFKNGKLLSIDNDKPFEFDVYASNEENHKRYNAIGRLIANYIYSLLENECLLIRMPIPTDAERSEPTGFFFISDDFNKADHLMIIIHGSGAVRAGQWSRNLIMNENIHVGSQIDYIKRARQCAYAVIVTNTNLNTNESSVNESQRIRGSESPEEHANYIWESFVRRCPAAHICIMAHSYGGAVVLELASRFTSDFNKRVFAIALSDSPMKAYAKHYSKNVLEIIRKKTVNWASSDKPVNTFLFNRDYGEVRAAGHLSHAWTSYTAFDSVFQFFREERKKLERI